LKVQVQNQAEDAKVIVDDEGFCLLLRKGLVDSRAVVALDLALASVLAIDYVLPSFQQLG
jgi:hypothetical protein